MSGRGEFLEPPMRERHRHRALPHGPGDALGRAAADVAGGEEARDARLEGEWVAFERPSGRAAAAYEEVRAREGT
ncbi:MAG TPA: hypothetical protein VES61_05195 [Gaiellaceae bacterium]|nr:hypothetical protein [Gaiellaceae bacterium]